MRGLMIGVASLVVVLVFMSLAVDEGEVVHLRTVGSDGLEAEADAMLPVIVRAVHVQMQNQFRPENAMYAQLPNRCLGGVRKHLESYSVRIDYVQHSLQAFLALHRLMEAQGIESLPVE